MREAHSHIVLGPLVSEHRHMPRLGGIERQGEAGPLDRVKDVLYEVAANVQPLSRRAGWRRCA